MPVNIYTILDVSIGVYMATIAFALSGAIVTFTIASIHQ